jgi:arylsulfatase A
MFSKGIIVKQFLATSQVDERPVGAHCRQFLRCLLHRTIGLAIAAVVVALLQTPETTAFSAEPATRPNIVFILADDLGIGDLGCYNSKSKVATPNMDRIAAEGMRFNDAHTPSSVCSPTRYGVLTGRYAWRSRLKKGVLWGYSRSLIEPGRETVASLLKKQGYATAAVGKWHLGLQQTDETVKAPIPAASEILPEDHPHAVDYSKPLSPGPNSVGFDYFFGIPASLDMNPYVYVENDRVVEAATDKVARSAHRRQGGGGVWRGGKIAPSFKHIDVLPRITEKATEWLGKQSAEKPFFLYFPLSAPHTPWVPTKEFMKDSKVGYYGGFVAQVDWVVGQVLKTLDERGLADNTLIVMTSDNGSHWPGSDITKWNHAANMHYRGQKADIWEAGHRVPFLVRWPGHVAKRSTSDKTVCLTDFMATAAEVTGGKLSDSSAEDSLSLLSELTARKNGTTIARPPVVHHSLGGTFAIRKDNWKLVVDNLGSGGFSSPKNVKPKPGQPAGQLYDLANDPSEKNNLYDQNVKVVKDLRAQLDAIKSNGRSR